MIDPELLACPRCPERPPLREEDGFLVCTRCGWRYRVVKDVPHLLPEEALPPACEENTGVDHN